MYSPPTQLQLTIKVPTSILLPPYMYFDINEDFTYLLLGNFFSLNRQHFPMIVNIPPDQGSANLFYKGPSSK